MNPTPKTTGKDFFLHLALIVSLYSAVGFLLNLLFSIIDTAYPVVAQYSYFGSSSISFPVAALIILTPVFLLTAFWIGKSELLDPSRKEVWVKKWSSYLTLFISGTIIVGDSITVLYQFLDGQALTTSFILKVLAIFVVLGAVFGYFWSNMNGALSTTARNVWRYGSILLVLTSIILGFVIIGSPRTQRLMRYDEQKVSDLINIQSQVINYWQSKGSLPQTMNDMKDSLTYDSFSMTDVQTQAPYEYTVTGPATFKLCAMFNLDYKVGNYNSSVYPTTQKNENWMYKAGHSCFERTIDPQLYPIYKKGPQIVPIN